MVSAEETFKLWQTNGGSLSIADLYSRQNIRNENIPQTELNVFFYIITTLLLCDAYGPLYKNGRR